jgi:Protein of unknown function (DUF3995)
MRSIRVRNTHRRLFAAEVGAVGALLDQLGRDDDALWPHGRWPSIRLHRPITVGEPSGHGDVRYTVDEYIPGTTLQFRFDPSSGFVGRHGLTVEAQADGLVALTHTLDASLSGSSRIVWILMIRSMHDQLVEEMLGNAEALLPGTVRASSPAVQRSLDGPSRWGRTLRASFAGINRLRNVPEGIAVGVALVGFGGAAALHAAWALGATWPGVNRSDLALKVVGTTSFPSDVATWAVVGLLSTATALTANGSRTPTGGRVSSLTTAGLGVTAAVLGVRAVGGFVTSTVRLVAGQRVPFVPRDLLVYSPLCAALAVATTAVAVRRVPDRMSPTLDPRR